MCVRVYERYVEGGTEGGCVLKRQCVKDNVWVLGLRAEKTMYVSTYSHLYLFRECVCVHTDTRMKADVHFIGACIITQSTGFLGRD